MLTTKQFFFLLFNFQEIKLSNSLEERVRNTTDRVEHITTKMEDLNQKANCQIQSVQVYKFFEKNATSIMFIKPFFLNAKRWELKY